MSRLVDSLGRVLDAAYFSEMEKQAEDLRVLSHECSAWLLEFHFLPKGCSDIAQEQVRVLRSRMESERKAIDTAANFLGNYCRDDKDVMGSASHVPKPLRKLFETWWLCRTELANLPTEAELKLTKRHHEVISLINGLSSSLAMAVQEVARLDAVSDAELRDLERVVAKQVRSGKEAVDEALRKLSPRAAARRAPQVSAEETPNGYDHRFSDLEID